MSLFALMAPCLQHDHSVTMIVGCYLHTAGHIHSILLADLASSNTCWLCAGWHPGGTLHLEVFLCGAHPFTVAPVVLVCLVSCVSR